MMSIKAAAPMPVMADQDGSIWVKNAGQWYCVWDTENDPDDNSKPYERDEMERYGPFREASWTTEEVPEEDSSD